MQDTQKTTIQQFESEGDSRYGKYSEYKQTDRSWLEVPAHWEVRRLKYCAEINPSKNEVGDLEPDTEVTFLPMENVSEQGEITHGETELLEDVIDGYTYFRENDILVAKITPCFENRKGTLAKDLENGIGFGTTEFVVLRPSDDLMDEFLYYVTASNLFRKIGEGHMKGAAGQKRVPDEFFQNFPQVLPPTNEQQAIAEFLNRETSKISNLIRKKKELINLIEEKRTALITDAVTQGLDSSVEMKPSGVPGLGLVPEKWDLIPLKYSSRNITVGIVQKPTQYYVDDGVPALRSLNVNENEIIEEDFVYISDEANDELKGSQLHSGDLVSVRSGDPGTTAVVPDNLDGANCIDLIIIREPNGYNPEFLSFLMNSEASTSQIEAGTEGAAQQHFNVGEVKELVFPKPDLDEQREILDWLSPRLQEMDETKAKIQESIESLKEYRTALITEAVTGQIDVRGEV
jgi:type I restriction enzyme S subunit